MMSFRYFGFCVFLVLASIPLNPAYSAHFFKNVPKRIQNAKKRNFSFSKAPEDRMSVSYHEGLKVLEQVSQNPPEFELFGKRYFINYTYLIDDPYLAYHAIDPDQLSAISQESWNETITELETHIETSLAGEAGGPLFFVRYFTDPAQNPNWYQLQAIRDRKLITNYYHQAEKLPDGVQNLAFRLFALEGKCRDGFHEGLQEIGEEFEQEKVPSLRITNKVRAGILISQILTQYKMDFIHKHQDLVNPLAKSYFPLDYAFRKGALTLSEVDNGLILVNGEGRPFVSENLTNLYVVNDQIGSVDTDEPIPINSLRDFLRKDLNVKHFAPIEGYSVSSFYDEFRATNPLILQQRMLYSLGIPGIEIEVQYPSEGLHLHPIFSPQALMKRFLYGEKDVSFLQFDGIAYSHLWTLLREPEFFLPEEQRTRDPKLDFDPYTPQKIIQLCKEARARGISGRGKGGPGRRLLIDADHDHLLDLAKVDSELEEDYKDFGESLSQLEDIEILKKRRRAITPVESTYFTYSEGAIQAKDVFYARVLTRLGYLVEKKMKE